MKKSLIILLVSSLFLTSCSIFTEADEETLELLEKHNMTVWETTVNFDPEQKQYMRILSNPKKIAEQWHTTNEDQDCYDNDWYL